MENKNILTKEDIFNYEKKLMSNLPDFPKMFLGRISKSDTEEYIPRYLQTPIEDDSVTNKNSLK